MAATSFKIGRAYEGRLRPTGYQRFTFAFGKAHGFSKPHLFQGLGCRIEGLVI